MIKKIIISGLITAAAVGSTVGQANAQSPQDQARAYFFAAEEAYQAGNYQDALKAVQRAESLSGQTGPLLLKLEAQSLFKLGRYEEAKSTLNEFYASSPSASDQRDVASILLELDEKLEVQRRAKAEQEEAARRAALKRQEAVRLEQQKQRRTDSFNQAKNRARELMLTCASVEECLGNARLYGTRQSDVNYALGKPLKNGNFKTTGAYVDLKSEEMSENLRIELFTRSCSEFQHQNSCLMEINARTKQATWYDGDREGLFFMPSPLRLQMEKRLTELCDQNHARSCMIKGAALSNIPNLPEFRDVETSLSFYPYHLGSFSYFDRPGAKIFRSGPEYKRPYKDTIKPGGPVRRAEPFLKKACELNDLYACGLLAWDNRKKNKRFSKNASRFGKKILCDANPDLVFQGWRPNKKNVIKC